MSAPYYDELQRGQAFTGAPPITLTEGLAAVHHSIVGNRLMISLERDLARAVTGAARPVAHPALVWDLAIGQSTVATQRVIANLFYRGLVLRRAPGLGDTLRTTTTVVALRDLTSRPGRTPGGLAALQVVTVDQEDRVVLDFVRCAMLPLSPGAAPPGHDDDLDSVAPPDEPDMAQLVRSWNLSAHPAGGTVTVGRRLEPPFAETVSGAMELARLTLNVAGAHHDAGAGMDGRRLVYGGHTVGLALAQINRVHPTLIYVAGWRSCDHPAPVWEGDALLSSCEVVAVEALDGAALVELDVRTIRPRDGREVLRWRPVAVIG